jgi:hypothetical protein
VFPEEGNQAAAAQGGIHIGRGEITAVVPAKRAQRALSRDP